MSNAVPLRCHEIGVYIAVMRHFWLSLVMFLCLGPSLRARAEDVVKQFKKAVERSTLDQTGTKPFHLKATIAPSLERDNGSHRAGSVEIWWQSPTQWRREVSSPEFHQIAIVDGTKEWQKNDGDYFPEWLREISAALVKPVPSLDRVLDEVKGADVKALMGQLHASWVTTGSDGVVSKGIGAGIALNTGTGLLFYGGDVGWDFLYADYKDFHNRDIARKVSGGGSPEVTAAINTLENLPPEPANFFDASQPGGDTTQIQTAVVEELTIRKNLLAKELLNWPPLENGPIEGVMITQVVIDREGHIRDVGTPVSDNPGLNDAAREQIAKMTLKPYLVNGIPEQVVTTITLPFKTVRPAGIESFQSARNYFDDARKTGFATEPTAAPYTLKAEFVAMGTSKKVDTGRYEDTWVGAPKWRREVWFEGSHMVRARDGDQYYSLLEGPDASMLKLVCREMEPVPATEVFAESDWRIKRETLDGQGMVRVLTGYESPDGKFDPSHTKGYWFDEKGRLVQAYFAGLEGRRSNFVDFDNMQVAKRIDVRKDGALAMRISVNSLGAPAGPVSEEIFKVPGHEDKHTFTDEVR